MIRRRYRTTTAKALVHQAHDENLETFSLETFSLPPFILVVPFSDFGTTHFNMAGSAMRVAKLIAKGCRLLRPFFSFFPLSLSPSCVFPVHFSDPRLFYPYPSTLTLPPPPLQLHAYFITTTIFATNVIVVETPQKDGGGEEMCRKLTAVMNSLFPKYYIIHNTDTNTISTSCY
jgi:hypothetical protein